MGVVESWEPEMNFLKACLECDLADFLREPEDVIELFFVIAIWEIDIVDVESGTVVEDPINFPKGIKEAEMTQGEYKHRAAKCPVWEWELVRIAHDRRML